MKYIVTTTTMLTRDDQFLTTYCKKQRRQQYFLSVVLQGATTTVDCNKHLRSLKQQPTFSTMWINHVNNREGAKRQQ
jgi:hypothetical protein